MLGRVARGVQRRLLGRFSVMVVRMNRLGQRALVFGGDVLLQRTEGARY